MKLKYRNTGFMRQLFLYAGGKYSGLELGRWYLRYYRRTPEGVLPKYKEISKS